MALPKLTTPTYELEIPSTDEKISYRPFLVKEEKILLMAMESGKNEDVVSAVKQIVSECTFNKLKLGVCESGNPGMASGGMGDILSGLIGSFIAQGLNLSEATETAVEIHSASADIASQDLGELGLLASDVIKTIRLNLAF